MSDEGFVHIGRPPEAPTVNGALKQRRTRIWLPLGGALAVIVIGAVALVIGLGLVGGKSFEVKGSVTLFDGYSEAASECWGKRGYDDIHAGTQVVITDAAGKTIAVGSLDKGWRYGESCRFAFTVPNVPAGHDFYGIEVSHRKRLQYDAQHIRQELNLGIGG